ncbi:tetratricopeptide repeat-containing sensor histidine kinase [Tenacibaculum caenipelagi]|uniref:histidine kinase n=1 Tax=Tenacibaculum caenipelagi TaxID=1325435 RepID=A0A4R6TEL8_9FLAO|nr:tetratricopeptide repeat-containing sensor histidine kinase [Tenacibaculum caenipelagi]TDQ28735.1 histidine kinase [Tenacibaculum caenipelagi]
MRLLFLTFFLIFTTIFSQEKDSTIIVFKKELIENGRQAFFNKKLPLLKKITLQVDSLYKETKDSILLAKYFHFKALENKLTYTNDSAFYYYHFSKDISKQLNDSLAVGRRLLSLANLQRETKDYLGGEISAIEALNYLEPIKSLTYLERVYNNLGLTSEALNQKKDALKYYRKALEINKVNKNDTGFLFIVNNIGILYQRRNQHKRAIEYFKRGLAFDRIQERYPVNYALLLENVAASNFLLEKRENVLAQYNEVLGIWEKLKNYYALSTTHINLADYHKDHNQIKKAIFHSKEALKYAKHTHNNKKWLEALQNLSDLTTGKQSKQYLQEYITLNDSLFQNERQLKNQFAKIRYETDIKEKENTLLKSENKRTKEEITRQKQQKLIGWLLAIISLLGLAIGSLFFALRKKQLLYQTQLQKTKAKYLERDRIAQELHDGVLSKLFGTRLSLGFLNLKGDCEELNKHQHLLNELQNIEKEIRLVSHKLSYNINESDNFKLVLIELFEEKSKIGSFEYNIDIAKTIILTDINEKIKHNIYRILQEILQNCIKHAKATNVELSIYKESTNLVIDVKDNGIGFDSTKENNGIGLKNIHSRAKKLNSKIEITTKLGEGTCIKISIPINFNTQLTDYSSLGFVHNHV